MNSKKIGLFISGPRGYKIIEPLEKLGADLKVVHAFKQRDIISSLINCNKIISKNNINFVICDMPYLIGIKAMSISRSLNVPFILRLRGDVIKEADKSIIKKSCNYIMKQQIKRQKHFYLAPVSEYLGKNFIEKWELDNINNLPIHNYIEPNQPPETQLNDSIELISVMNMNFKEKVQGLVDFYLSACSFIKRNNIEVTIIGNGTFKKYVEDKLDILKPNVRMVGHKLNVSDYFTRNSIFIHSSYLDAFPSVVLEAMSHGLPIIAGGYKSVKEQVLHDYNGLIVNPVDKEDVQNCLERLYNSIVVRERMSNASYKVIEDKFSLNKIANRWSEMLNKI
ncbi:MAG: glycosyltransferase family 4 protein [Firmicutes bacterium]|nr:glycosyltransferase family 4 protein [Bacillota bacterium]